MAARGVNALTSARFMHRNYAIEFERPPPGGEAAQGALPQSAPGRLIISSRAPPNP